MALINLIVKDDKETKKLLKQINCKLDKLLAVENDETVAQLEKQMDSWLLKLDQSFKVLEQVSEKVDSKK